MNKIIEPTFTAEEVAEYLLMTTEEVIEEIKNKNLKGSYYRDEWHIENVDYQNYLYGGYVEGGME